MKKILIFMAVIGLFAAMSVTSCTPKQTPPKTDSTLVDSTHVDSVKTDTTLTKTV